MAIEPLQTERAHDRPMIRQYSVFLPNRVGQLREFVDLFVSNGVHLVALDIIDMVDWAVVRAIFSHAAKAAELMKQKQMAYTESRVLAVAMATPDELGDVCDALIQAELNVHVAYPLLIQSRSEVVVAVQVDELELAARVLARREFDLLDEGDLWPDGAE